MLLLSVFVWGILLSHMVALHYTFISAMLAATAVFLFMTIPGGLSPEQFVIQNIPSVLLVILAYQLRTEMLLFVFPFICLAGLFRWSEEAVFFRKEHFCRYGLVFALILLGMLGSRMIDFAAYGSDEWKAFLAFFNARTEVYDFHGDIFGKEEFRKYQDSLGLNDAQVQVLKNYNIGIDERIDAELMGEIAEYALANSDYFTGIREKVKDYDERVLQAGNVPYHQLVIFLYIMVALSGVFNAAIAYKRGAVTGTETWHGKRWSFLWKLLLLGTVRNALWLFIIIRRRIPERITHSLYLVEAMLLAGMLWREICRVCPEAKRQESFRVQKRTLLPAVLFGMLCLYWMPHSYRTTAEREASRENSHRVCYELDSYCRAHPENFYFKSVYETVGSSQKIFQNVDNTFANHDIMGGWLCKSPLYDEKLARYGIATMEEGLLTMDSVYFITKQNADVDWLPAYYAGNGLKVDLEPIDMIGETFAVYRLK